MKADVPAGLRELVRSLFPAADIADVERLEADASEGRNRKSEGYGCPLRVTVRSEQDGAERKVVFHTALANEFGHDRRSDRAEEMLLAWDSTADVPRHVASLDVGVIMPDGKLQSLSRAGEFYLLTTWCEGSPYADDLRRVSEGGTHTAQDLRRVDALAQYLVQLHGTRLQDPVAWRRSVRDLVGHGEGIFGIIDAYAADTPAAPAERLERIEHQCLDWRWKLKSKQSRLRRTHGDFHPFNVIFREGPEFSVLDASRGCMGDPADDVTAMAINYVFFAVDRPSAWKRGLAPLWYRFWERYLTNSHDADLLDVVPPFLAWRGLVVACPRFYPSLSAEGRDRLLTFVERALETTRFDPASAEALFR